MELYADFIPNRGETGKPGATGKPGKTGSYHNKVDFSNSVSEEGGGVLFAAAADVQVDAAAGSTVVVPVIRVHHLVTKRIFLNLQNHS